MKSISTVISCLLLISCSQKRIHKKSSESQFYVLPKEYEKVYGTIKSITESSYFVQKKSGIILKDSIKWTNTFKFNNLGNEIEIISFYGNGNPHWKTTNTFNKNNQLVKVNYFNAVGELNYVFDYYYNAGGELIEFDDCTGEDFKRRTRTKYKYAGDSIELIHYNKLDSFDHNSILKKDKKGNVIEFKTNKHDGSLWFVSFYSYNKVGDIIVDSCFQSDGSLSITISEYGDIDNEGNWLTKNIYVDNKLDGVIVRQIEYNK